MRIKIFSILIYILSVSSVVLMYGCGENKQQIVSERKDYCLNKHYYIQYYAISSQDSWSFFAKVIKSKGKRVVSEGVFICGGDYFIDIRNSYPDTIKWELEKKRVLLHYPSNFYSNNQIPKPIVLLIERE